MYDSFDSFRLRIVSVLSSDGRPQDPGLKGPSPFSSEDDKALMAFGQWLCAPPTDTGDFPGRERAGLSYTFTGSLWKELFGKEDHEGIEEACLMITEHIEGAFRGQRGDILPVAQRFHGFYSELIRKKEDCLSRSYGDAQFSVMDLGLRAWDVLGETDIERYDTGGWDERSFRNEIVERKLSRETGELKGALKELPPSLTDGPGSDGLIAVLLYDSLRTARCSEADKAEAFLKLSGMCGIGEIKSGEDWYLFRDNRTRFAAESFLMIHDVTDEDRFWKRMVAFERLSDVSLPLSTRILRSVHGLMSAFEAYTLCGDHYLPSGFSADEYTDRLTERLSGYIVDGA